MKKKRNRNSIILFIQAICCIGIIGTIFYLLTIRESARIQTEEATRADPSKANIQLIVFAWRRYASLKRLMESIQSVDYHGHAVDLKIIVDANPRQEVEEYLKRVEWPHGNLILDFKKVKHGLEKNIMFSWMPESDNEYAIFLEDDVQLSSHFFSFVQDILSHHKTELKTKEGKKMAGISLYTPRLNEIGGPELDHSAIGDSHFLFCLPCSWGAVYFSHLWKEFIQYYNQRTDDTKLKSYPIPWAKSNQWNNSWKKYYIEFMYLNGYYFLYPNYQNQISFSTNHNEKGVHTLGKKPYVLDNEELAVKRGISFSYTVPLITKYDYTMKPNKRLKDYPVVSLDHKKIGGISVLSQIGLIAVEKFFLETKTGFNDIKSKLLDYLLPQSEQSQKEQKYIYSSLEGSVSSQLHQFSFLYRLATLLERKLILKTPKLSIGINIRSIFSTNNDIFPEEQFHIDLSSVNQIKLENNSSNCFNNDENTICVPFYNINDNSLMEYYFHVQEKILWFSLFGDSFQNKISHLLMESKIYKTLCNSVMQELGKYSCAIYNNHHSTLSQINSSKETRIYIFNTDDSSMNSSTKILFTKRLINEKAQQQNISEKESLIYIPIIELAIKKNCS